MTTTLVRHRTLLQAFQLPTRRQASLRVTSYGSSLPCRRKATVKQVQTLLQILLEPPQHFLLLLVRERQVPEAELLSLLVDSIVQTYICHCAATENSAHG
jgi:hypothetical protein